MMRGKSKKYIAWGFFGVLIILIVVAILNREWIYDFYRGVSYAPTDEMSRIRTDLELTGRGEFLFNASQPILSAGEEFNSYCREDETEIAILGCYKEGNIYVFNIIHEELSGIRELTAAHELLHAVFRRMSENDKENLKTYLEKVYDENKEVLAEDLENYDEAERFEELYVRAGTEVKDLPEVLEKHYAEIFQDQDLIVSYYENYITTFREIKAEMEELISKMDSVQNTIEEETTEYEKRAEQLNADIVSFNSCAEIAGCFENEYEFYARRRSLISEQEALGVLYDEIDRLVDEYNGLVEKYNADVIKTKELNEIINSSSKIEEIE